MAELTAILNNPVLRGKSIFYRNGGVVSAPTLIP